MEINTAKIKQITLVKIYLKTLTFVVTQQHSSARILIQINAEIQSHSNVKQLIMHSVKMTVIIIHVLQFYHLI
jgi:hypothetical protein